MQAIGSRGQDGAHIVFVTKNERRKLFIGLNDNTFSVFLLDLANIIYSMLLCLFSKILSNVESLI